MRVSDEKEAREADCLAADVVDRDVTSDDREDVEALLVRAGCRGTPTEVSANHSTCEVCPLCHIFFGISPNSRGTPTWSTPEYSTLAEQKFPDVVIYASEAQMSAHIVTLAAGMICDASLSYHPPAILLHAGLEPAVHMNAHRQHRQCASA